MTDFTGVFIMFGLFTLGIDIKRAAEILKEAIIQNAKIPANPKT